MLSRLEHEKSFITSGPTTFGSFQFYMRPWTLCMCFIYKICFGTVLHTDHLIMVKAKGYVCADLLNFYSLVCFVATGTGLVRSQ